MLFSSYMLVWPRSHALRGNALQDALRTELSDPYFR